MTFCTSYYIAYCGYKSKFATIRLHLVDFKVTIVIISLERKSSMKTTNNSDWAIESARATLFKELHIAEFWMPQITGVNNCNLKCKHCYVYENGRPKANILSPEAYVEVLRSLMTSVKPFSDKWDIVFPGMEPLLPRNAAYIRPMAVEAARLGARSIGITTNGTLMHGETLEWLVSSPVSTVNVSLDGSQRHHDWIRGNGTYAITTANARKFCNIKGKKKAITNTTVMETNSMMLSEISRISRDIGCDYAAFHPFETAVNADNALDTQTNGITLGFKTLIQEFLEGHTGSVVIEFEAGTAGCFFRLLETGILDGFKIMEDETQFRFLRKLVGKNECLINLIFYPHHFVRTVRVLDNGSLSSCRMIAKHGWCGVGNLINQSIKEISRLPETILAAADIWDEYRRSLSSIQTETIERYLTLDTRLKGGD